DDAPARDGRAARVRARDPRAAQRAHAGEPQPLSGSPRSGAARRARPSATGALRPSAGVREPAGARELEERGERAFDALLERRARDAREARAHRTVVEIADERVRLGIRGDAEVRVCAEADRLGRAARAGEELADFDRLAAEVEHAE